MPALQMLDSDVATPFTAYNFGNIPAGSSGTAKLIFISSYASGTASGSAFGIQSIVGNDGSTYAKVCSATSFVSQTGTGFTGTGTSTGGSIPRTAVLKYKLSYEDAWLHETGIENSTVITPTIAGGVDTNQVALSWTTPVTGVSFFGLYLSTDGGATYKKVTRTTAASYTDTSGTATAVSAPASGAVAYLMGTWGTTEIALGDLASGTKTPVGIIDVFPSGTSAVGNPRQWNAYCSYQTT